MNEWPILYLKHAGCLLALLASIVAGPAVAAKATNHLSTEGCLDWRWVGLRNADLEQCPSAVGWDDEPLFSAHATGTAPALADYCLYTASTQYAQLNSLRELLDGPLQKLDRDCVAVTSQSGGALSNLHWPALEEQFLAQAGAVESELLGPNSVELVIVDTNPSNDVDPELESGNADHGHALVTMADRLLCADSGQACAVDINSRLAFRFLHIDGTDQSKTIVDDLAGGYNTGSLVDLARAVQIEVRDWADSMSPRPLVLNLSLGWNPRVGGLETPLQSMPLGPRAVYAALQDARCRGALVLAAAGNRDGASLPQNQALLPAGWETRPASRRAQCDAALGNTGSPDPRDFDANAYRPLVYGVGGVEASGSALGNSRPQSAPRLAAFADHATVASLVAGQPATAVLTGSSVSTLLASINAAMIWSWQRGWSSDEVVAAMYGSAQPLGRSADVCLGPTTPTTCSQLADREVRRLSLCEARAKVAAGEPFLPGTCDWDPTPVTLTADYSDFDLGSIEVDLADLNQVAFQPGCRGLPILHDGTTGIGSGIGCPQLALASMGDQPWLLPQPGSSICPECPLGGSAAAKRAGAKSFAPKQATVKASALTLRIEIHSQFQGSVSDVTLSHDQTLYRLHGSALVAGDRLLVRGLEMIPNLDGAAISFSVNDTLSNTVPVLRSQ